jgi:hypothetical protein
MRLLLAALALLPVLISVAAVAQDDPNETPLGDVARNLRKKNPPSQQQVIDDDNLPQVMQQADSHAGFGSALRFLMAGDAKGFQVATPDVTCSLSFTATAKTLLSSQYAQMELPPQEIAKLQGQATIEGDALTVPVINGTNWHVSELAVALTVVKKTAGRETPPFNDSIFNGSTMRGTSAEGAHLEAGNPMEQVRPEKKPDVTVIYRMRAAAPPWARTVFSAPLDVDLAAGDEWHWAIVQAKGYPPQDFSGPSPQTAAQADSKATVQPASALAAQGNSAAVSVPQNPQ